MSASKKPRKKYKPRLCLQNPVGFVLETLTPVREQRGPIVELRIKNSEAMLSLTRGTAKKLDIDLLIAMSNVAEALYEMGVGSDYGDTFTDGRYALLSIVNRAVDRGRFVPTGEELTMLNKLIEVHDAQLDSITVGELDKAVQNVEKRMQSLKGVAKLPPVPEHLL